MDTNHDYYDILGVSPSVEPEALKAVYRALAKKYHPDTTTHTSTSETFRDIQEAYDVLSDPKRREVYDRERSEEVETPVADDEKEGMSRYADGAQQEEGPLSEEDTNEKFSEDGDVPRGSRDDVKEKPAPSIFWRLIKFLLGIVVSAVVASLITGIAGVWLRDTSFSMNAQSNILFGLFIGTFAVSIPIFLMGVSSFIWVCMNFLRGLIKPARGVMTLRPNWRAMS